MKKCVLMCFIALLVADCSWKYITPKKKYEWDKFVYLNVFWDSEFGYPFFYRSSMYLAEVKIVGGYRNFGIGTSPVKFIGTELEGMVGDKQHYDYMSALPLYINIPLFWGDIVVPKGGSRPGGGSKIPKYWMYLFGEYDWWINADSLKQEYVPTAGYNVGIGFTPLFLYFLGSMHIRLGVHNQILNKTEPYVSIVFDYASIIKLFGVEEIYPPSVSTMFSFSDIGNNNGVLESNESGELRISLKNTGKGPSADIEFYIAVDEEIRDRIQIKHSFKQKGLKPGETRIERISVKAGANLPEGNYRILITGIDKKGYRIHGGDIYIRTKQTEPPYLTFETTPFDDNQDKIFDAGEMVGFKLYIRNQGRGEAFNVKGFIKDKYGDVLAEKVIGSLKPAETREITLPFQMPTDLKTGKQEFKVALSEMSGFAPETKTIRVEVREYAAVLFEPVVNIDDDMIGISRGDGERDVDKGEMIELIVSVRNNGTGTARKVKVGISSNQTGIDFITHKTEIGDIQSGMSKDVTLVFVVKQVFTDKMLHLDLKLSEMTGKFTKRFPLKYELGRPLEITIETGPKSPVRKNTYTLIIGINNYEDKSIPSLKYAENDAKMMEILLKNNGIETVWLLMGKNATKNNIEVRLAELEQLVNEKSFVYIFFSGHGTSRLFENDTRYPYYLSYNTDATNATSLQISSISWADLTASIRRMKAKGVVVAVNACYGIRPTGAAAGVGAPEKPPVTPLGEGRVIMSASAPNQMAYEVKEYNNSIFFYRLLEALKGEGDTNDDGWVDANEVFNWVCEKVEEDARKIKRTLQTPTINPKIGSTIKITRVK